MLREIAQTRNWFMNKEQAKLETLRPICCWAVSLLQIVPARRSCIGGLASENYAAEYQRRGIKLGDAFIKAG